MRSLFPSQLHLSSEELLKFVLIFVLIFVTICCIFGRMHRGHLYSMQLVVNNKAQLKLHLTYRDKKKCWQTASPTYCFTGLKSTDITDFRQSDRDSGFGSVCLSLQLFSTLCQRHPQLGFLHHSKMVVTVPGFTRTHHTFQNERLFLTFLSAKIMRFFLIGPAQVTCPPQNCSLQLGEWNVMVGLAQVTCSPLETSQNMKPLIEIGGYWKGKRGGDRCRGQHLCQNDHQV